MNRWFVVVGAICIQLCLGAVYAWSLFNEPLSQTYGWAKEDVVITFSITIATFAFFTIIAGKVQDMIGPRWVASIGGLLLALGLLLSSQATTVTQLYLFYGIIGGAGIGIAYVCPIAACVKWFPMQRGTITGVAVAGFGAGGLVFKPVIVNFLENFGVSSTFLYLGIIYLLLVVGGAQLLRNPPHHNSPNNSRDSILEQKQFTTPEMLKTRNFYLLWIMFLFGCVSGLMVISFAVDIGVQLVALDFETAGTAVMVIALFNASGRIVFGFLSDKIGRKNTLLIIYALTGIIMFFMGNLTLTYHLFLLFVSLIGFCFGGFLSIFPSITADYYGTRHIGINYGILYQAYGVAAFLGPLIVAFVDSFQTAFFTAAILCGCAILLSLFVTSSSIEIKEN
ncbi:MAG: OFA family MFS transporter [Bacillaceae bacterium]|nr:OFA family MFS transporter [Bacillaceae bacterium]